MLNSLLSTKLHIPQVSQKVVHRPRLTEQMTVGLQSDDGRFTRKVTLVSAPAGYGKTTLIAQWLSDLTGDKTGTESTAKLGLAHHHASSLQIAWLALDGSDNDLSRFFSYLIAALQGIDPSFGSELQPILETEADLPIEPFLTALVNDIADGGADSRPGRRFILVLDDYHVVTEFSIHQALDFLIDHIPPCMHLVIMTRVDPPMPLGRMRVQRALLEIREVDLRFAADEATWFLNNLMELDLSAEEIDILEARTEGWIAGLQLAALTLLGRADTHTLIADFSGSHRHLIDYLGHEVMSRQSEEVQTFLLRTSILDRFNASLCDAVLGIEDWGPGAGPNHGSTIHSPQSKALLEQLESANLFLIPLDNERQWYRYHHLFADFLRQRLRETEAGIIPELFIRASQWYEAQGLVDEAIEFAFDGGDVKRAAKLLDESAETLVLNAEIDKVLRWADRLPEDVRAQFPRLCIYHAWALQFEYKLDLVEPTLALAEAHLAEPAPLPESFSVGQIAGHASAIRAYTAGKLGELDRAVELSLAALRKLPQEDTEQVNLLRGIITLGLGMGYLDLGQLEAAYQSFQEALPLNQMARNHFAALSCLNMLMNIEKVRGALNQVQANGEKGLLWIDEWSRTGSLRGGPARNLAYFRREIGLVQYERNELKQAAGNLSKSCQYFELAHSWQRLDSYTNLVDLYQAMGDADRALEYMRKLERFSLRPDLSFPSIPVSAYVAQRHILLGQSSLYPNDLFAKAARWAESLALEPTDDMSYAEEYVYCTLARVLIAQQSAEEAVPLLVRLIKAAKEGGRNGHLITYLSLQAMAYHSLGEADLALSHLSRALSLAEPEGYVRTIVDLGPLMQELLQLAAEKSVEKSYIARLLSAFPIREPSPAHPLTRSPAQPVDSLNEREMQILRLMAARLSNQEIADELYLSVNTVKWYARSLYDKLGVANRREAASRAQELGLLSTNPEWRPGGR